MTRALRLAVRDVIDSPIKDSPDEIRPIDGGPGFKAEGVYRLFSNLVDEVSGAEITHTRSGAVIYRDIYGKWRKLAANDAFHTKAGLLVEGQSENLCTNYNDGSLITGVTKVSGDGAVPALLAYGSVSGVDFTKVQELIDDGDLDNVIRFNCTSATVGTVYKISGGAVDTTDHSFSIFGASIGGDAELALTASKNSPVTISGSLFDRVVQNGVSPAAASDELHVFVPAGADCYVNLNQLENAPESSSPIVCLGGAFTRATDGCQVPTFADNYLYYSKDFDQWTEVDASYNSSTGELTFDAVGIARIAAIAAINDLVDGETYTIYLRAKQGTQTDFRLGVFDSLGFDYSANLTATSDYEWYSYEVTPNSGATGINVFILNTGAATAGSIFIDECIVSTSPIRPKHLETTGSAKIFEKGNLCVDAENIGAGSWTAGNGATVTDAGSYGVFIDGRTSTSLIEDANAAGNAYWLYSVTGVADDSETRYNRVYFRKTNGAPTHYPCLRSSYGGGSGLAKNTIINTTTGEISSNSADSAETELVVRNGQEFWQLTVGLANDSSGNTSFNLLVYPAWNTDGSSGAVVTTVGTQEVGGAQIIDYDIDTDDYLPTWGSARKLRYNQIWENRMWFAFRVGYKGSTAVTPVFLSSEMGSGDRVRVTTTPSTQAVFTNRVSGINYFSGAPAPVEAGGDLWMLCIIDPDDGMDTVAELNGTEYTGDNVSVLDLQWGDTIRIGNLIAGTNEASGEYSDFKWGILPAGGVTLERVSHV